MKRLVIVGCGGAGKTTAALEIGKRLSLPVVHLDKLYWVGDWEHLTNEAFDEKLLSELNKDAWIIEGNYQRTLPLRISYCDEVLYLDYHPIVCVFGVLKRVARYRGQTRPDMGGQCRERFDWAFLQWVLTFRRKHGQSITRDILASGKPAHVMKNRRQLRAYINAL